MTTLTIDPTDLLTAFKSDTRVSANTMPYALVRHGYTMVPYKSAQLLRDAEGLWKIRSLTRDGISFASSNTKGTGRSPSEQAWQEANQGIAGYLVYERLDVPGRADVNLWKVPVQDVLKWKREGRLGVGGADCSRAAFLGLAGASAPTLQSGPTS